MARQPKTKEQKNLPNKFSTRGVEARAATSSVGSAQESGLATDRFNLFAKTSWQHSFKDNCSLLAIVGSIRSSIQTAVLRQASPFANLS